MTPAENSAKALEAANNAALLLNAEAKQESVLAHIISSLFSLTQAINALVEDQAKDS